MNTSDVGNGDYGQGENTIMEKVFLEIALVYKIGIEIC